mmetsp:Transcript_34451/g.77686  ORF Transcript_34451/g.77686 Transcript_34451/m.77686 type:complete len:266 (+) Transcript_34451:1543-2340(+)
MGEDDGLVLDACRVAVLPCQHVDLPLIDAKLADVRLEEEDVGSLHEGIQDLGRSKFVLQPPHDLATLLDSCDRRPPRNIQRLRPVRNSVRRDLLRAPHELNFVHVHPCGLPDLHQVLADSLDLLQVSSHLVVHQRKPVGHPEDESPSRLGALVHIHRLEDALSDVHAAGGLKPVVQLERIRLLGQEKRELAIRHAFLSHTSNELILPFDHRILQGIHGIISLCFELLQLCNLSIQLLFRVRCRVSFHLFLHLAHNLPLCLRLGLP